ncbi:MAG: RNA polymerase factor sigma-54 [Thermomicrobiales bacterium]
MAMMELGYDLDQEQRQRNLPRLIEANYLLHLSSQELETVITTEMHANPALEVDERLTCAICGHVLDGGLCHTCLTNSAPTELPTKADDEQDRFEPIQTLLSTDEEFDEIPLIADELDVLDLLMADVRSVLPKKWHAAVEIVVNSIDDRGFLSGDWDELENLTGCTGEELARIVGAIQELAPAGVGARDLRESLRLQIRFLREEDGVEPPALAEIIVDKHLSELGAHRYHNLARSLRVTVEEISEAHDFIRTQLSPHPLQDSRTLTWRRTAGATYVVPDVLITIIEGDLNVEVVGHTQERLRVNGLYDELAAQLRRRTPAAVAAPAVDVLNASDEDRVHIRDSVTRAKQFISKLRQRRETLLKISLCISQMQQDFLRGGIRELRPLTRSEVAVQVGVHESTVSRATANKFVMLPNRKVIPFSDFFTPSLSVKDVIRELIDKESAAGQPLSDMRIRDLLMDEGYRIARRTVAKYRAELRILPSTVR